MAGKGGNANEWVMQLMIMTGILALSVGMSKSHLYQHVYDFREYMSKVFITGLTSSQTAGSILGGTQGTLITGVITGVLGGAQSSIDGWQTSVYDTANANVKAMDKSISASKKTTEQTVSSSSCEGSSINATCAVGLVASATLMGSAGVFTTASLLAMIVNNVMLFFSLYLSPFMIFLGCMPQTRGYFSRWFATTLGLVITMALQTAIISLSNLLMAFVQGLALIQSGFVGIFNTNVLNIIGQTSSYTDAIKIADNSLIASSSMIDFAVFSAVIAVICSALLWRAGSWVTSIFGGFAGTAGDIISNQLTSIMKDAGLATGGGGKQNTLTQQTATQGSVTEKPTSADVSQDQTKQMIDIINKENKKSGG